jgi:hypothetical protein
MQYIGKGQTVHTLYSLISLELLEKEEDQYYCFLYKKEALHLYYMFFGHTVLQTCSNPNQHWPMANLPPSHIWVYTTS